MFVSRGLVVTKRSHAAHEGRVGRFGVGFMLLALAAMMFYGLIVKVTFGNPTLFTLKTYIPEVCIALGRSNGNILGL